ncbi:MAG: ribonuclease R [Burkholderiaceae bacterium]
MTPTKKAVSPAPEVGVVSGHRDGHGFVVFESDHPDVYLPPDEMRAVMHGDHVNVRVVRTDRRGRAEGRVTHIVARPNQTLIGRLVLESGVAVVAPEDRRYGKDVLLARRGEGSARPGQVVVVELVEPPVLYAQPVGRVVEVLGEVDDPGMEVAIAVRKFGVPHVFTEACMGAAQKLPAQVQPADCQGRVDLTDVPLVTIDGEDARDFDDAVYAEPARVGKGKGWRLLVAIADVSHYVREGDPIDQDAAERGTSVYFPRQVIPMLPEKLANGLCSLVPEVARLTLVCDMLVDAKGKLHAYQFYPAVIKSHARLTYTEVAHVLQDTRQAKQGPRAALLPHLVHLQEVFEVLWRARDERGAIEFETTETAMVLDDDGRILRIEPRVRNQAHRIIEEAMLAANVCAADALTRAKVTSLYRVHEGPTPDKFEVVRKYLQALGVGVQLPPNPQPKNYRDVLRAVASRPDAGQIQTALLRSMQQAIYSPHNSGHFGLAYEAYSHFTSPIRRYPDLLVHRCLKALAAGQSAMVWPLAQSQDNQPKRKPTRKAQTQAWEAAGLRCSMQERRADEASRDVQAWLKCWYMRGHLGEEYDGQITSVTGFGLFVVLQSVYVEGLVHITELGGEYFHFDDVRQELRGERTGVRYHVGAKVRVQVSRVDLDGRRIDFRLVRPAAAVSGEAKGPGRKAGKTSASGKGRGESRAVGSGKKTDGRASAAKGRGKRGKAGPSGR